MRSGVRTRRLGREDQAEARAARRGAAPDGAARRSGGSAESRRASSTGGVFHGPGGVVCGTTGARPASTGGRRRWSGTTGREGEGPPHARPPPPRRRRASGRRSCTRPRRRWAPCVPTAGSSRWTRTSSTSPRPTRTRVRRGRTRWTRTTSSRSCPRIRSASRRARSRASSRSSTAIRTRTPPFFYFLPETYHLGWRTDQRRYDMAMLYLAATTPGSAGEVSMAAGLTAGIDQDEINMVEKLLRAYCRYHPCPATPQLRPFPIDPARVAVSLAGTLQLFNIPKEKVAPVGLSNALGDFQLAWVTDAVTKENVQLVMEQGGINGNVTFAPPGSRAVRAARRRPDQARGPRQLRAVPLQARGGLAEPGSLSAPTEVRARPPDRRRPPARRLLVAARRCVARARRPRRVGRVAHPGVGRPQGAAHVGQLRARRGLRRPAGSR